MKARTLRNLALGVSLGLLVIPADVLAGRGGGRGGGGGGMNRGGGGPGGGGGMNRGGGGGGGVNRGGGGPGGGMGGAGGGMNRGGGGGMGGGGGQMSHSPSFSQPRSPTNGSRPQGFGQPGGRQQAGNNPNAGAAAGAGFANRNPSGSTGAAAGAGLANRNQPSNAGAAAGAGFANRNQPSNAGTAAAGAGLASRNQPTNAGAAAAGAGFANRNQPSNAGAAAAGAGLANRNQPNLSNAGAAAAGAGLANRNQPNLSNAGAAALGAGVANRNQPNFSNAGAAAAGAAFANNRSNFSNAGAAAVGAATGAAFANRNAYNGYNPGMVNGYWNGNNAGLAAYGVGAAAGVAAWGAGSPMYGYGYSSYANPYAGAAAVGVGVPQQAAAPAYDYAQPISTTAPPPEPNVADQATSAFALARQAFQGGDYPTALQQVNQALGQTPNDTNLHEFLGLVQFAQGQYDRAAETLYAVLSVGPGWDWTTLSGLYGDASAYTTQLRALESYSKTNPQSAQAYFTLAYHYLCQGHDEAAAEMLQKVVAIQPKDTLSAQLLAKLRPAGASSTPPPPPPQAGAVDAGKLAGTWVTTSPQGAKITLTIKPDGAFSWAAELAGKPPVTISGTSTFEGGLLSLASSDPQAGTFAGQATMPDDRHFTFRAVGAPTSDPGLSFAR